MFLRFGVPAERVRLIAPHAIAAPAPRLPENLERFYRGHRPVLLTVGLLEPEYDLELQIELLGELRQRFPGAGLVIAGSGSLEQRLREAIRSKPYAEHVLLAGDVAHAETLRAIFDCDVFLRTTKYDGDSVAVREALHFGTPVIATDNGMRPEGVELIPPSDLKALREAVEARLDRLEPRPVREIGSEENIRAVYDLYSTLSTPG